MARRPRLILVISLTTLCLGLAVGCQELVTRQVRESLASFVTGLVNEGVNATIAP